MEATAGMVMPSWGKSRSRKGFDAARERLRRLPKESGRSAAEDEKARAEGSPVGKNPQQRKQIGSALDLVNHHQFPERAKRHVRLAQPGEALPISQISS